MRTPPINLALAESISHERLGKYLAENAGDLSLSIGLYEKNCRLSESFYSPLQSMEICLRNRLSAELARDFGSDWLQNGAPPFDPDAVDNIAKAVKALGRPPVTEGRIIAELSFGFWVGLLGTHTTPPYGGDLYTAHFAQKGRKRDPSSMGVLTLSVDSATALPIMNRSSTARPHSSTMR